MPYWALARFGKWDEILKEPEPPAAARSWRRRGTTSRGLAFVAKSQLAAADKELRGAARR